MRVSAVRVRVGRQKARASKAMACGARASEARASKARVSEACASKARAIEQVEQAR